MVRSIASIIAGFTVWTLLWLLINQVLLAVAGAHFKADGSTDHTGLLLVVLAASVIFSVSAGWLTIKIAQRRPVAHTLALGLLLLAVGIVVQLQYWSSVPIWYHLAFLALLVPASMFTALRT